MNFLSKLFHAAMVIVGITAIFCLTNLGLTAFDLQYLGIGSRANLNQASIPCFVNIFAIVVFYYLSKIAEDLHTRNKEARKRISARSVRENQNWVGDIDLQL